MPFCAGSLIIRVLMGGERRLESYVIKRATVNTESPPSRKIPKIAKGELSSIYEKFGVIIFLMKALARQGETIAKG